MIDDRDFQQELWDEHTRSSITHNHAHQKQHHAKKERHGHCGLKMVNRKTKRVTSKRDNEGEKKPASYKLPAESSRKSREENEMPMTSKRSHLPSVRISGMKRKPTSASVILASPSADDDK